MEQAGAAVPGCVRAACERAWPGASRLPLGMLRAARGFTLIELLVVMAIVGLLLTIATPRYIQHVERAREATLRSSLKVMRDAIEKFQGDQGRYPKGLDELVAREYLHAVPVDPITDKRDTWVTQTETEMRATLTQAGTLPPAATSARSSSVRPDEGVANVLSGAPGKASDGTAFQDW